MKLIECKDCGKKISKRAKVCPNCGASRPQTSGCAWIILFLIFSFLAVLILTTLLDTDNIDTNDAPNWNQNETAAVLDRENVGLTKPESELPIPVLVVTDLEWQKDDRLQSIKWWGRVKNVSREPVKSVEVFIEFFDSSGDFVSTSSTWLSFNPLLPNQTSPFEMYGNYNPAIERARISNLVSALGKSFSWKMDDKFKQ